jgi:hypothetical protein
MTIPVIGGAAQSLRTVVDIEQDGVERRALMPDQFADVGFVQPHPRIP